MDDYIELTERLFSTDKMYLRISNIFIFIIACTRVFGKITEKMGEDSTSDILEPLEKNTNVFLWAMLK